VLKQQPNGDCVFLGGRGCTLSLEARPLVCRLYPYDFTEQRILAEPARGCPVELLLPNQRLFEVLELNQRDAVRWHQQLYQEIRMEQVMPVAS
jgi:Fe-S-cluster containining protein